MRRRVHRGPILAAAFLALCAPAAAAENRYLDAVLDVMPDMADRFETVHEFMAEKKWDRALEKLAEIAEEAGDTVWSADGRVYIAVRDYIRDLIISMPPDGLRFYRRRYDGEARGLYEEGLAKQDVALLDAVDRKYPASSYAAPALDAAASLLMDRGEYRSAGMRLEQLLSRPEPSIRPTDYARRRAMALVKLAYCMARLGDRSSVRTALERLRRLRVRPVPRVGGGETDGVAFVRSELERGLVAQAVPPKSAWPTAGGSFTHARPMQDVRPNLSRRWTLKIGDVSAARRRVDPRRQRVTYPYYGRAVSVPQAFPLPVTDEQGVVYVNTGKGVYAVEHITGRLRWLAKPAAAPTPKPGPGGVVRFTMYNRMLPYLWANWQGATSVSVGGGRVYAVEVRSQSYQMSLALCAFDASSGKRLWSFVQRPDAGEFETGAYFPWAPKFLDGRLVGLACYRGQMFLCALDARTGKVRWSVFLAADPVRQTNLYYRRTLQLKLGQPVVIADGVAYAATGMGAVAAVDVRTGWVRWIAKYPRSAIQVTRTSRRFGGYTQYRHEGGWKGGFPVVSGGRLYVAPWDANALFAFDLRSGRLVKQFPRGQYTHFAGVHRGDLVLVGPETAALDPHTGLLKWLVPTPFDVKGLPILTRSAVVFPTTGTLNGRSCAMLCSVRLDGRAVRVTQVIPDAPGREPLGNLVSCEGRLVAANRAFVSGYFAFAETYEYLTERIRQHPDEAKPMVDRGGLSFLHASRQRTREAKAARYRDALRDLHMAETVLGTRRPVDVALQARVRRMLFETYLKLSEVEPAKAVEHVDAARKYIFDPVARARFHLARGGALSTVGRYQDAVDEYLVIVKNLPDVPVLRGELTTPAGLLAQSRLGALVEERGEGVYTRVDAALRPEFDRLVAAGDAAGLRKLQLLHPHSSLADNCLLEMARIVQKEKFGRLRAQTLLRSLTLRYPRSEVLGEAYRLLLSNALESSQYRLAALVVRDLRDKHASVRLQWEGRTVTGKEVAARLMERPELQRAASVLARGFPVLCPPLRRSWRSGTAAEVPVTVVSEDSPLDRGVGLAVNVVPGPQPYQYYGRITRLRAFDTATGRTLWTANVNVSWSYGELESGPSPWRRNRFVAPVVCSGGIVALGHPEGIAAFDLATGQRVWERKWTRPASRSPVLWFDPMAFRGVDYRIRQRINQRPVFAGGGGRIVYYLPDGTLVFLDAATGRPLWRAKHAGYAAGPIGLLGDRVLVAGVVPNRIYAHDAFTGKLVYSKPLAGQFPSHPTFDAARNRVFLNDGVRLYCYKAGDFKKLWQTKDAGGVINVSVPWCVRVLPGNLVAVTRYARVKNRYGYGVVVYDGRTGRTKWSRGVTRYQRDRTGYTQSNLLFEPLFGKHFAFLPVRTITRRRDPKTRRYTMQTDVALHVLDLGTGREVHKVALQPKSSSRRYSLYFAAAVPTTEHLVIAYRKHSRGGLTGEVAVISGRSGKAVFRESTGAFSGVLHNMLFQRLRPVITVEGNLLVPTGKGLVCYRSAGPGTADGGRKEKKNDKK